LKANSFGGCIAVVSSGRETKEKFRICFVFHGLDAEKEKVFDIHLLLKPFTRTYCKEVIPFLEKEPRIHDSSLR